MRIIRILRKRSKSMKAVYPRNIVSAWGSDNEEKVAFASNLWVFSHRDRALVGVGWGCVLLAILEGAG
ncbi:hypothetical protein D3C86_1860830 [compost metagenome]